MTPKELSAWFATPGTASIELSGTLDMTGVPLRGSGKTITGGHLKRARVLATDCVFNNVTFDCAPISEPWYASISCYADNSQRLTFNGCKFLGGTTGQGIGLRANDVDGITVSGCEFRDTHQGPTFQRAKNILVENSLFHSIGENGITGAGVENFTVRGNVIRDITAFGTAHPDGIQTWTAYHKNTVYPMKNVVIEDNVFLQGNGGGMQAIFHRSRAATPSELSVEQTKAVNFTVRRNLIYGWSFWHGIYINEGADGVTVEDNLVLSPLDSPIQYRIDLKGCNSPIVRRNVSNTYLNGPTGVLTKSLASLIPDLAKRSLATEAGLRLQAGGVRLRVG